MIHLQRLQSLSGSFHIETADHSHDVVWLVSLVLHALRADALVMASSVSLGNDTAASFVVDHAEAQLQVILALAAALAGATGRRLHMCLKSGNLCSGFWCEGSR